MSKHSFHSLLMIFVTLFCAGTVLAQSSSDVNVSGVVKPDKVKKGRVVQATVTLDIPSGLHVQSSRPLDKFLVATKLDVEAPTGMRVGAINYPRALMRNLKFSKKAVAVYEGRVTIRFNVTVPANASAGFSEIKGRLRFQACNDDSCFPPVTREVKMGITVQ